MRFWYGWVIVSWSVTLLASEAAGRSYADIGLEEPADCGHEKPAEKGQEKSAGNGQEIPAGNRQEKPGEKGQEKPGENKQEKTGENGQEKPGENAQEEPVKDGLVVSSPAGKFRGRCMQTRRGRQIEGYLGIRYAQPPLGALRFQPPVLITNYTGEVDATVDGPACPQPSNGDYPVDEDCLRINVYTPAHNCSKALPVVMFLHPGGFYIYSGRSDFAGPDYLLDRDMVLVAINYRLGSLGFLSTGDELAPGNNGFKDQVVALRWVQQNIRAFGGNPKCVTIAGYSAGSFSVALHMVSPMSKGLFHRAISMSGSPISQVEIGTHQRHLAVRQAKLLNCSTNSTKEMLSCLNKTDYKQLGDSLDHMFEFGEYDPVLLWNVVIEPDFGQERFLTMQPLDAILQKKMHAVPYIISQTRDEFFWKAFDVLKSENLTNTMASEWDRVAPISFMLPRDNSTAAADALKEAYFCGRPLTNDIDTFSALGELYSDAVIGFGVHRLADLMRRHSPHYVFFYEFDYIGQHSFYEDPETEKPVGVAHHDELLYLFAMTIAFPIIPANSSNPDSQMVDKMTALWYNFIRHGDPGGRCDTLELAGISWPHMSRSWRRYLRIGRQFSVHTDLFKDRFRVWDKLFPINSKKAHPQNNETHQHNNETHKQNNETNKHNNEANKQNNETKQNKNEANQHNDESKQHSDETKQNKKSKNDNNETNQNKNEITDPCYEIDKQNNETHPHSNETHQATTTKSQTCRQLERAVTVAHTTLEVKSTYIPLEDYPLYRTRRGRGHRRARGRSRGAD